MFSFFIPEKDNPEKYRDLVMERWNTFISTANGSGLILLHENEKNIYGDSAERCLDILQTMNCSYLKVVFDPANFVQCNLESYPKSFEILKDYIVYVHIKDARYKDFKVMPAGYGDGKVQEILYMLKKRNFNGFISLEPHLASFIGLNSLELNSKNQNIQSEGYKEFEEAIKALKKILSSIS